MLSPAERRQLGQIENQLAAQDPGFAARMRAPERLPPFPIVTFLCFGFYVVWPFIALLAGPTAALIAVLAFGTLVAALVVRRRAHRPG
jgi:hypothetical protein